jgi:alkyl hydroperoxide reductase subunit AhpC
VFEAIVHPAMPHALESSSESSPSTATPKPEGNLRYQVVHDLSIGRSAEDTLRVIQALQTGGLCKAEWRPGDETLKVA